MNYKLLFIFSLLLIVGCSKEPINMDEVLILRDDIILSKITNKPYSGPVFSLYSNGETKLEGTLKNGVMSSGWRWYSPEGVEAIGKNWGLDNLNPMINKSDDNYPVFITDGKGSKYVEDDEKSYLSSGKLLIPLQGKFNFLEDNNKWFSCTYMAGIRFAEYIEYYWSEDYEQMVSKGDYYNGLKYGKWTYWYENGQKKEEGKMSIAQFDGEKKSLRDGPWTHWYENGQKHKEGSYSSDTFVTRTLSQWIGEEEASKMVGQWTYYKKDGSLDKVIDCDKEDCGWLSPDLY